MKAHWQELSTAGRALVVVIGVRLVFGLYLALNDHFSYHDTTSAVTVLAIYVLLGGFALMFLYGKRSGLWLLLGLCCASLAHAQAGNADALFAATLTGLDDQPAALAPWRGKPLVVNF